MDFQDTVTKYLEEALKDYPSLFLIDLKIGSDKTIAVSLDGDHGVKLQDCVNISRFIEGRLDRDTHDFSLQVASAGVGNPLQHIRQYKNNIGRKLEVSLPEESSISGTLVAAEAACFTLEWKQREPKPIGKGKVTVKKNRIFFYDKILNAKVIV